jgi:hypothetical protein
MPPPYRPTSWFAIPTPQVDGAQGTSGTAGCHRAAPSAGAPSAPSRRPGAAAPATASPAQRGPPDLGVQPLKGRRHDFQRFVHHGPDRPHWMVRRNPRFTAHVAEQTLAVVVRSAHRPLSGRFLRQQRESRRAVPAQPFFRILLAPDQTAILFGNRDNRGTWRRALFEIWPACRRLLVGRDITVRLSRVLHGDE